MRKDDAPEEAKDVKVEGKSKGRPARQPMAEADESMGEDALLGEATLAKLNVTRKVDDTPAEAAE
jgi:hypothetical protein